MRKPYPQRDDWRFFWLMFCGGSIGTAFRVATWEELYWLTLCVGLYLVLAPLVLWVIYKLWK